jgi:uncharacterized protein YodC (DUF2158 family)
MTTDHSPWIDLPGLAAAIDPAAADHHPPPTETPPPFKAGDVVRLRSGGPRMTVILCDAIDGVMGADCLWFVAGRTEAARFPAATLAAWQPRPPRQSWLKRALLRLLPPNPNR